MIALLPCARTSRRTNSLTGIVTPTVHRPDAMVVARVQGGRSPGQEAQFHCSEQQTKVRQRDVIDQDELSAGLGGALVGADQERDTGAVRSIPVTGPA